MTTPFENFVNIALGKSLSSDVTLPTANEIPVFTGIGRQVTGKTIAELGLASKDIVYIPNSTDPFPLTTKTLYMIGDFITTTYGDLYLQLPPLTASTIIEVQLSLNIEQIGHVFITPSGTDLIFGQGTPLDLKDLPLAPGCTVKLFFHSVGLGWVGQANYSDHFIDPIIHPFNATSWTSVGHRIVSESTGVCNLTIPNGSINLGTMSSVATTDFNDLSGTRNRIVGGSHNTVSGTDNIAIGCFSTTLDGIGQVVLGASASARLKCNDITVLGSSQAACTNIKHFLYKGITASCYLSNAAGQANVATPDTTNCPRAALAYTAGVSLFELRFVSNGYDYIPTFVGSISGCRVFSVHSDGAGGYTVSAVATPYADMATGGLGITFAITTITAVGGEELLQIIPTVSGLGVGGTSNNYATLDAIYQF